VLACHSRSCDVSAASTLLWCVLNLTCTVPVAALVSGASTERGVLTLFAAGRHLLPGMLMSGQLPSCFGMLLAPPRFHHLVSQWWCRRPCAPQLLHSERVHAHTCTT
jgi:hypothetical protein